MLHGIRTAALNDFEQDWLSGITMSLKILDGFFTALVIGPENVAAPEYVPKICGTADGSGPDWDSDEQLEFALDLLTKHWNSIAARRSADTVHAPLIDHFSATSPGEDWANGFIAGVRMRRDAWDPIFADSRADQIVLPILALSGDSPLAFKERFTPEMRQTILDDLPAMLQMIAAYWRYSGQAAPRYGQLRSNKVGRNAPCLCGSGRKFKRCCGSGSGSTVH